MTGEVRVVVTGDKEKGKRKIIRIKEIYSENT